MTRINFHRCINNRVRYRQSRFARVRARQDFTYVIYIIRGFTLRDEESEYLDKSLATTRFTRSFAFTIMLIFTFVISSVDPYPGGHFGNDG